MVRLRVLGSDLDVRCDGPTADALRELFGPFLRGTPTAVAVPTLAAAGNLSVVAAEINALALAGVASLAVHAGAVAAGGAVAAFPAASGHGKTTLSAACLLAGLDYVSDEALCLDWHDGSVRPYPRPLALSPWSAAALGLPVPADGAELLVPAAELGADVAAEPLRLAHLVLLDPPGGPTGPRPVARSAVAAELLRRSFTHWHRPQRAFELVHEVVGAASVWRLSRSTPAADAAVIAALLAG